MLVALVLYNRGGKAYNWEYVIECMLSQINENSLLEKNVNELMS